MYAVLLKQGNKLESRDTPSKVIKIFWLENEWLKNSMWLNQDHSNRNLLHSFIWINFSFNY